MSDHVWLSNPVVDSNIHYRMTSDRIVQDKAKTFDAAARMRRARARSRNRHGGFAPVAKNSCLSAPDPKVVISIPSPRA